MSNPVALDVEARIFRAGRAAKDIRAARVRGVRTVVNEVAVKDLLMLEQEVEREVFLVAELRSETQLGVRQVRLPFLAYRTRRTPIGRPVARLLVEIIVLDGSVPDIGTRDNVHEHIVPNFEKVAEPYHGLQRLLGCRREDSRGEKHTCQESLYH